MLISRLNAVGTEPGTISQGFALARATALREMDDMSARLVTLRALIVNLQQALTLVAPDADGAVADPLAAVGNALDSLLAVGREVEAKLGGAECEAACTAMLLAMRCIGRSGLEFQMIAKLTATTVATLGTYSRELTAYAAGFDVVTDRLLGEAASVERRMQAMASARVSSLVEFRQATDEIARARRQLRDEGDDVPGGTGALEEIQAAARRLRDQAAAELGRLVWAIQFVDAFAQRAEHLAAAVEMVHEAEGEAKAALAAVARALAADLRAGFCAMATCVDAALSAIRGAGEEAREAFARELHAGTLDAALRRRQSRLRTILAQAVRVMPQTEAVVVQARDMAGMAGSARQSLADLEAISSQIFLSSMNAGLISSRTGAQGGPLAVLTLATQEQASTCSQVVNRCATAIGKFIEMLEQLPHAALREEVTALETELARIECGSEAANAALAALAPAASRIAAAMSDLRGVEAALAARLDAARDAVDLLSDSLPPGAGTTPAAAAHPALQRLRGLYTMEREREVHDQLFGIQRQPEAVTQAEELDDILF